MRAFALRNILPLSKSAPLACCALMILSVSSRRVGIKRRAMDMVIAISWVGTPTRDRGPISRSIPSVSAIGFVVKVSREEPMISRISLRAGGAGVGGWNAALGPAPRRKVLSPSLEYLTSMR